MPCYVTGSRYGDAQLELEEARKTSTKLSRMLCSVCTQLEKDGIPIPKAAKEWWTEHKKIDREREAQERAQRKRKRLRQQALNKLTKEEREALR